MLLGLEVFCRVGYRSGKEYFPLDTRVFSCQPWIFPFLPFLTCISHAWPLFSSVAVKTEVPLPPVGRVNTKGAARVQHEIIARNALCRQHAPPASLQSRGNHQDWLCPSRILTSERDRTRRVRVTAVTVEQLRVLLVPDGISAS